MSAEPKDTSQRADRLVRRLRRERLHGWLGKRADAFVLSASGRLASLAPPDDLRSVHRAVSSLTECAVDATWAEDAWYVYAKLLIEVYLEDHGVVGADAIAADAISGRFSSWITPDEGALEAASGAVFDGVQHSVGLGCSERDALAAHVELGLYFYEPPDDIVQREAALGALPDGFDRLASHHAAIARLDRPRGEERAERMHAALGLVVAHAEGGLPLEPSVLRRAHAAAMGLEGESPYRTRTAFAKGGADRYGMNPPHGVDAVPVWEMAGAGSPCVECARAYLDVCFFHPFDDGNARAARLLVAWFDVRLGIGFSNLVPAFSIPRVAGDVAGAWELTRCLLTAAEAARRGV